MTLLSVLQEAVRNASSSNPHAESAPACVLWPDAARSFEALLPQLMAALPELYVLGEYAPDERRGPAIWLRYQLDGGKLDGLGAGTPIFYLPRISRQDLRPEADCPFLLAPLCELMFRGKVWAHENGKDWTPAAFLISRDIELAGDSETRKALQDTLPTLMKMDVVEIAGQGQLNAPVLHELLHPEPVESLLAWLNDPKGWKASQTREQWTAFAATCKTKFDFEPAKEGELGGAERLGGRINNWSRVWRAFERAPERFPGVVDLLVKVRVRPKDLFTEESSWPQINRDKEESLRLVLLSLADTTPEPRYAKWRHSMASGEIGCGRGCANLRWRVPSLRSRAWPPARKCRWVDGRQKKWRLSGPPQAGRRTRRSWMHLLPWKVLRTWRLSAARRVPCIWTG